jgi:hypothetical protein
MSGDVAPPHEEVMQEIALPPSSPSAPVARSPSSPIVEPGDVSSPLAGTAPNVVSRRPTGE